MFGYVRPLQAQLRVCENETYKAVYCGMCRSLGREYGFFARLTLSYDFTFLALLDMALTPAETQEYKPRRCFVNPLKKVASCEANPQLSFSGGVAMILFYYKVLDNLEDSNFSGKLKATLAQPFAKYSFQKAADNYPEVARVVYETISLQMAVEQDPASNVDMACEPTANALKGICSLLAHDDGQRRILERLGYCLGRYIYLADALDDLEEDIRQKSFNPFLRRESLTTPDKDKIAAIREDAKGSIYLSISEIIRAYDLLEVGSYKPILDNIIHLGLHDSVEKILLPKEERHT